MLPARISSEWGTSVFPFFCIESLIQVRSGEPKFHLELLICSGNSQSQPGSESEETWKVNPFQLLLWCQHSWDPLLIADSMLIPKISVWIKPEPKPMNLALCWTVRLSFKTIRWMASTCLSLVEVYDVPAPLESRSPFLHCCIGRGVPSKYLYRVLMDFLGCLSFADTLWLLGPQFCSFLDLLHTSHLCMILTCTEIKIEIWISFF